MNSIHLLIVEKRSDNIQKIEDSLTSTQKIRILVSVAHSLSEAFDFSLANTVDVILLNTDQDEDTSLDHFKQMRHAFPDKPVVVYTENYDENLAMALAVEGAADYLTAQDLGAARLIQVLIFAVERHVSASELLGREVRYRQLYEKIPVGYQSLNKDGMIIEVNQAWLDMLGYRREEVMGHWFGNFLKSADQQLFGERFPLFKARGEIHNVVFNMVRKDGSSVSVGFDGQIGYDENHQFRQTHCTLTDLTEKLQTEKALQDSNIRFQRAILEAPIPIMIHDESGQILQISKGWTTFSGYTLEDIPTLDDWTRQAYGTRSDLSKEYIDGLFAIQKTVSNGEWKVTTKSGEVRIWDFYTTPLDAFQADQRVLLSIAVDVTDRKFAEDRTRASEMNLKKAQSYAHIGSWIWHIQDNVVEWSDEMYTIFGIQKEYFTGRLEDVVAAAIHPDDREKVQQSNLSVIQKKTPVPLEYRIVLPDQSLRTVWAEAGELVENEDGSPAELRGVVQDITERKKAEETLRSSELRYHQLFEEMTDGFALHEMIYDENGNPVDYRFLEINPAFERQTGLRASELVGKTVLEALPETESYWIQLYGKVVETGVPLQYENFSKALNKYYHVKAFRPEAGKFAVLFSDVTEQKEVELAIQNKNRYLSALQETTFELISEHDLQNLLENIVHRAGELIGTQSGFLDLVDTHANLLKPRIGIGLFVGSSERAAKMGEGLVGRIWETRSPLSIDDYDSWPGRLVDFTKDKLRFIMGAPLLSGDTVLGVLGLGKDFQSRNGFSKEDLDLLVQFARLATIAIENAQLIDTVRKQADELSRLYRASDILISDTSYDLKSIASTIVDIFIKEFDQSNCSLFIPDLQNGHINRVACAGIYAEEIRDKHLDLNGKGLVPQTVRTRKLVNVPNVQIDSHYVPNWPAARSEMAIPLLVGEKLVGVIDLQSAKLDAFHEDDERLMSVFAERAAMALESTVLYEKERRRLIRLSALQELGTDLSLLHSERELFDTLVLKAAKLAHSPSATVMLYDDAYKELVLAAQTGLPEGTPLGLRIPLVAPQFQKTINDGKPFIVADIDRDAPELRQLLVHLKVKSFFAYPLMSNDRPMGILTLSSLTPRNPSNEERTTYQLLAKLVSAALENVRMIENTNRTLRRLASLRRIDMAIANSFELTVTLNILLDELIDHLHIDAADVLLNSPEDGLLKYAAGKGFRTQALLYTKLHMGESFSGRVALERRTIHVPDLRDNLADLSKSVAFHKEDFITYIGVPLIAKGQVKGVLEVFHRKPLVADQDWLDFLEILAGQAAIAVDNVELFNHLQRSNAELSLAYDSTLEGWASALDLREKETGHHARRVAEMTLYLANHMHVSSSELMYIRWGALLHDIGKIAIPDEILLKNGPLSEDEWKIMRTHPQYAYQLLSTIEFLRPALDIPYCHHEKWDGSGYPNGLKGKAIPLAARIFAVVDVWDALTSDRPYRKAWTHEKTMEYIVEQSGKHFDPDVVNAFVKNADELLPEE
ncbi:MAG: hypothetical protein CVU39_17390 [Chloroflexi bacterium HGW-Chloroflexi-10]|nr:MAG: hypothetical protein CVU39_17390 [Chloroflexi bacterium HGW-Chloroflexi-10]